MSARSPRPAAQPPPPVAGGSAVRSVGVDTLRGSAMCLLLLLHACNVPGFVAGIPGPPWLDPVNAFFAPFRMPALMFVSGVLLQRSLAKPLPVYVLRKLSSLVWPYLIWSTVLLMSAGLPYFFTFYANDPRSWIATGYLWYLFYLICYFAVAPLIAALPAWIAPTACVIVAAALPIGADFQDLAYFGIFFFGGHAFVAGRAHIERWLGRPFVLVALTLCGLTIGTLSAVVDYGLSRSMPLLPLTVAGVLVLGVACDRLGATALGQGLAWVGRNSVVFYTTHWPTMLTATALLVAAGLERYLVPGLIIATALVAVPLSLLRRHPPVRWLFEAPLLDRASSRIEQRRNHRSAARPQPRSEA